MTISIRFSGDTNRTYEALRRMRRAGLETKPVLNRFMSQHARTIPARSVREQRSPVGLQPWKPLTSGHRAGQPALKDTGALIKAFRNARVTATNTHATLTPSPNLPRFWKMQIGGEIKSKRPNGYLAIPLNPEARKAKTGRKWWTAAAAAGKRPFVFTSKKGNKFLAYSRDGRLVLCFLLRTLVKIPKRVFMGFGKRDRDVFVDMCAAHLARALGGTAGA